MLSSLGAGFTAILRGGDLIIRHRALWPYAVAPIVIALFAFSVGIYGAISLVHSLDAQYLAGLTGALEAIRYAALALAYVGSILVALVLAKTLILPCAASPFNVLLSKHVERLQKGPVARPMPFAAVIRTSLVSMYYGLATSLFGILVLTLSLPLLLVPVVGPFLFLIPSAYVEALNALDCTFQRRPLSLSGKRLWMREHRSAAMGLGAAIVLLNFIPFIGILAVPAAAAGATLLFLADEPRPPE